MTREWNNLKRILLATYLCLGFANSSLAKSTKKRKPTPSKVAELKKKFISGSINERDLWIELDKAAKGSKSLSKSDRVQLLQLQAELLFEDRYYILAAIYASQAIKTAPHPTAKSLDPTWKILRSVSQRRPIQNLLEVLASSTQSKGLPPHFGSDWHYVSGNAALRNKRKDLALSHYSKVKIKDRYFFSAKYQQAMIHVENNNLDDAIVALKAILNPTTHKLSPLKAKMRRDMLDYAYLAMGRIWYEQQEFLNSARMYRRVSRKGGNMYDSLFEQSWAFFLAGYPGHALGAIHSAESPFFKDVFNPEAPVLRSLIYYWLCKYEDSRNALADFIENNGSAVESLADFLDRKNLSATSAYQLFEDVVSGVSSESLGIPRRVLLTAAESDSMLLIRDQFASLIQEKSRLNRRGIFRRNEATERAQKYLDRWMGALKTDLGDNFLTELKAMRAHYDRLYAQAQFLYVELLMSEKDQLLGKQELHASSKIKKVSGKMKVRGWGDKTQAWKDPSTGEFWWDEVGFFIERVESNCSVGK